ncbi:FGGY-family carbohydrate kinase [Phytohabitans rumicis]|uniref:Xylulose kinase n=1 Tax=Phytohabitans rumicis TaxID=1076125 RepID=A0A6V8LIJ6_9ACTN|nr:FGGY family carbohydrate kinase [Phytohabitans rumicis]GFJ94668.1 xylulose kinase [Phytohabitans rumicis]
MTTMTSALLVGVDMGTSRVKAIAVDLGGVVRGEAERPTPWRREAGRTEVDPAALADLARTVAAEAATAAAEEPTVLGIGVTGMAETGVLVDGQDRPLAPAIAWHDPRGDLDTISKELGDTTFRTTTGLPVTPMPSLGKLLWLRRNNPDTKDATRFYSVAEWVVRRLGGQPVAELSLASRTGLLDLASTRPWDAATALLDWPPLLSDLVVAGTPAGRVGGDDAPPVLRGAVLTVAGHDHQVAAYGVGAATDGALFDSLGTAEALVRTIRPPLDPVEIDGLARRGMTVGWGVVAGHLCILAGLPTGLTLGRIATMIGAGTPADRDALGEQALAATAHPTLRLVDPRDGQFGLAGISDGVTPGVLWRTAVEDLVASAERLLERIDALAGSYRDVVAAGGWLRNPALLAAKRRQYPRMRTTTITEPGAYGAALLAAAAAGTPLNTQPQER